MLKLKLQYFGHLMRRVDSLEKTLMLGGIGGRRRRGPQRAVVRVTSAASVLGASGLYHSHCGYSELLSSVQSLSHVRLFATP